MTTGDWYGLAILIVVVGFMMWNAARPHGPEE